MKPVVVVALLLALFIVVLIVCGGGYLHRSYFSASSDSGECCSKDDKTHAGCMCKNPKYFGFVRQQTDRTSEITDMEGVLIDARCYALTRDNYTNSHSFPPNRDKVAKGCASACAKSGVPVALLIGPLPPGPESKAFILLHPSPNLAEHMEKTARISGYFMRDMNAIFTTCVKVKEKSGEWTDVMFTTPMINMGSKMEGKETLDIPDTPIFSPDIKPLFREVDVESMKSFGIDLSKHSDVMKHAEHIYSRVADGSMPCDGKWEQSKVNLFKRWMDTGMIENQNA